MREIRVLLVTDRPAVRTFFLGLESLEQGHSTHHQQQDPNHGHNPRSFVICHFNHFQIQDDMALPSPHPQSQQPEQVATAVTTATAVTDAVITDTLAIVDVMPTPATAIH